MINFAGYSLPEPIWLTGGGGKTSLMYYLAQNITGPLLLTTTTKLAYPPREEVPFYQAESLDQLLPLFHEGRKVLAGKRVEKEKIIGFSPEEIEKFYRHNPIPMLIEADGSNRRPLKIHLAHEPVLPQVPATVIAVIGLSALNKPYSSEYIHRGKNIPGRIITPEDLLKLVREGKYFSPRTKNKVVFLNQAEVIEKRLLEEVITLFKAIPDLLVTYGSLKEGYILSG
ncbi:selenium cofactor biosynthesis protein YqeC [Carboxydothermus pertinax]|uniref:Selenium-dependent hydroxylase accessory protein YqeC n=1 Tax=Carboxydothermus pertinax TaxID=870242 RepID=A0A1L8CSX8_9THEO|nr:selenium cofactor biosynthesis protein YqeC [Carboxydothermus pertinax]GAV21929.1 hypothetical protein cpu_04390 [Carboxydothermus pertinax]